MGVAGVVTFYWLRLSAHCKYIINEQVKCLIYLCLYTAKNWSLNQTCQKADSGWKTPDSGLIQTWIIEILGNTAEPQHVGRTWYRYENCDTCVRYGYVSVMAYIRYYAITDLLVIKILLMRVGVVAISSRDINLLTLFCSGLYRIVVGV